MIRDSYRNGYKSIQKYWPDRKNGIPEPYEDPEPCEDPGPYEDPRP